MSSIISVIFFIDEVNVNEKSTLGTAIYRMSKNEFGSCKFKSYNNDFGASLIEPFKKNKISLIIVRLAIEDEQLNVKKNLLNLKKKIHNIFFSILKKIIKLLFVKN